MEDKKVEESGSAPTAELISTGALDALAIALADLLRKTPNADKEVAMETIKRKSNALMLGMVLMFIVLIFAISKNNGIAINIIVAAFGFVGGFGVGRQTT